MPFLSSQDGAHTRMCGKLNFKESIPWSIFKCTVLSKNAQAKNIYSTSLCQTVRIC